MDKTISARRHRLYEVVEVGAAKDFLSRFYDFLSTGLLILNIAVGIIYTYEHFYYQHYSLMKAFEYITIAFFILDYIFRIVIARCAHPDMSETRAIRCYVLSLMGIIDLLSFLPYFLPSFFPVGMVAFRMVRVVRIFRLFRLNKYYDSLNVIMEVVKSKSQQLISSVFIIFLLMLAASLCMYPLEHSAQPDVYKNAFSGLWWSVSALLTVGYGDIYPITVAGRIFSILITFLGVGLVAIPTGIISAGFVEQYTRITRLGENGDEHDMHFISMELDDDDEWVGQSIQDLQLPTQIIIAMVQRAGDTLVPRGDLILKKYDIVILGAQSTKNTQPLELRSTELGRNHEWCDTAIRDLDISRQTFIVSVKRNGTSYVPGGSFVLRCGDEVVTYTKRKQK